MKSMTKVVIINIILVYIISKELENNTKKNVFMFDKMFIESQNFGIFIFACLH